MRALLLCAALGLAAGGCGDNNKAARSPDGGAIDAPVAAAGPCLDRPDSLALPPTSGLPCELLPPGFVAPGAP